jgi:hypothetical protein
VRAGDDLASLSRKVRLASILGTIQATLVQFPYIRDVWHKNTAEVRARTWSYGMQGRSRAVLKRRAHGPAASPCCLCLAV